MIAPAAPGQPLRPAPDRRWLAHALLAAILLASFLLKLRHLDHPAIKPLDEVFHAIVARNLMRHPLTPTLIDPAFLPFDSTNWQSTHIWLHKPPMALWQIALSFALLGVNTFALRLPSAILSTAAVWLTYGIGAELLDRTAGLIAAALQAFNPVILMLVNGYVFSDHVDISLLFWTELAIFFLARGLRTGRRIDWILCGIGQGLAFLSKTYPALIVSGLTLVAWMLPLLNLAKPSPRRMRLGVVAIVAAATAAVALPWMMSIRVRFPLEFAQENGMILSHLNRDVEGWAGPWDRVLFDYWISIFYVFYPAVLAALVWAAARALAMKRLGLWIVIAWGLGVLIPNLAATSKTMSATLSGWPAMWLLLGYLISLAWRGDVPALAVWSVSMVLAALLLNGSSIPRAGLGYAGNRFAGVMREHLWVVEHLLIVAVLLPLLVLALRQLGRRAEQVLKIIGAAAMVFLLVRWGSWFRPRGYVEEAWAVTGINAQKPAFVALGAYLQKLPPDAAMVVDERSKLESLLVSFPADHTCYPLGRRSWQQGAAALAAVGALPYFVSPDRQPLPAVFVDSESGRTVYACTPAALAAGRAAALRK